MHLTDGYNYIYMLNCIEDMLQNKENHKFTDEYKIYEKYQKIRKIEAV
jgi:hypothetical protein